MIETVSPGTNRSALQALLEARSVAIVGASPRPGTFGHRMVTEVSRSTAAPDVHLVNPRYAEILDRPCVASLADVPQSVDLVLLGVPDSALEDTLATAADRGDRAAVIFGSVYETPAAGRRSLRERVATIAGAAGMAMCGGGCMGFVNVLHGLRAVGYVEPDELPAGPVALVTHSGSVFSSMLRTHRRIGFTLAVSSGQELVTTAADFVHYALDQPETGVVALVLETLRDPESFRHALCRAAARDVPVVALTVGGSPAGRIMVAAHSGALAGADGAWEALFDAYGVLRVGDLDEMVDTLELFAAGRRAGPAAADGGIATVHDSGAERALVVDLAHDLGVPFATLADGTRRQLAGILEPGLEPTNPLDLWGSGDDARATFTTALSSLADDETVAAAALCVDLVAEFDGDKSYPAAVLDAQRRTDKPVVVLSNVHNAVDQEVASRLRAKGVPVLEGTRSGLLALRHLLEYRDARSRLAAPAATAVDERRSTTWSHRLANHGVHGVEAFALLADYGIRVTEAVSVSGVEQAVAAAQAVGFPVVVKSDMPDLAHKSDVGGVVLGLEDEPSVARAYTAMAKRLGGDALVCATAPAGVEMALGIVRDPLLGPLVVVGAGGVLVDLLGDGAVGLPPVDGRGARRLLDRLAARPLLDGARGAPAVDIEALIGAIVAVSTIAVELGEEIDALDINPLRCGPWGAVALDALIERRPPPRERNRTEDGKQPVGNQKMT